MKVEIEVDVLRDICYYINECDRVCVDCDELECPLQGKKEGAQL